MKNKIVLGVVLAGLLMAACGGDDPAVISADQAGDRPFVPPAEEPLDTPQTDGGTCIDMKTAIAARESADTHQGLILQAWKAGDVEQTSHYMNLVASDFDTINTAMEASPTASSLADSVSYGYASGALSITQAQIQFDSGNDADAQTLVDQANVALASGDTANVELTKVITTTDLDGAPLCETVIDDGAFKFAPTKINLSGGK